jgi:hypothetical protein
MLQKNRAEINSKFCQLQTRLRDRWQSMDQFDNSDYDLVVIPSISFDPRELRKIPGANHYEERLLFSLIRLRNPHTRLVYLTSQPLPSIIIEYYLQLLPGIPFSQARERLILLSTYDASIDKPLSQKILERPRLIERIKRSLRLDRAIMTCFNSTHWEQALSVALGIPLWGLDPNLLYWGTKSGSREIFAEAKVPFPDGSELVWNTKDLARAVLELWQRQPHLKRIVIKLNEGFSGEGNALLDLHNLKHAIEEASEAEKLATIEKSFKFLRFQTKAENWTSYSSQIPKLGAIAEAFIEGKRKFSPSFQGRIAPTGEVEVLSTHDQILGGPDGQVYLGGSFPAADDYRLRLQVMGLEIGRCLAAKGAMERYGVDFLAVQNESGRWDLQAIEINLRKGGTTHPFMTLRFLTNGRFDDRSGLFFSQQGREKYYVASDNLVKDRYRGLLPHDLMEIIAHHRLHFDSSRETGTLFHLMGCLSEYGKLGLTSIGNSPQQAKDTYNHIMHVLDTETKPD